tara:strand:- start:464 stop:1012 length:549 start_codon:yes stop_codon:yes gene_type:complete
MKAIPNILTILRIVLIPLFCLLYLGGAVALSFALFIFLLLTDFFDGWLARKLSLQSAFGAFLDPVADKLLVMSALVCLIADGAITGAWLIAAILILAREIWIPSLRGMVGYDSPLSAVDNLGKWKTATQMIAIALLLLSPLYPFLYIPALWLLGVAAVLTLISAARYTWKAKDYLSREETAG